MEDDDGRILDRDQKLFLQAVTNPQRYHRIDHELKPHIIYTLSNGTLHDMEEGRYPTFVHATHVQGRPERLTL
jgi:hypothetical protein